MSPSKNQPKPKFQIGDKVFVKKDKFVEGPFSITELRIKSDTVLYRLETEYNFSEPELFATWLEAGEALWESRSCPECGK